jgi:hypothetical protein
MSGDWHFYSIFLIIAYSLKFILKAIASHLKALKKYTRSLPQKNGG